MRLGEAAASVQFSRSLGAAFGTALVTAVLFAALPLKNPEAARLFAIMTQNNTGVAPDLPGPPSTVQADIADAFRAAFLSMQIWRLDGSGKSGHRKWCTVSAPSTTERHSDLPPASRHDVEHVAAAGSF
jgi:hypothetical protein